MPKKNTGKAKHAAAARKPRERRTGQAFQEDPPAVMSAQELADKFGVSHDTIRDYARMPHAPVQVRPGKWPALEFERFWALVMEHGGPMRYKRFIEESESPSFVKRGARAGIAQLEGMSEADSAAADAAATATTAQELNRLKSDQLAKAKLAEEVLQRRLANQERKRRLVPRAAVEEVIFARAQGLKTEARKLVLELPPKLVGLERPEIEEKLAKAFEQFFGLAAAFGKPIQGALPAPAEEEPPAPPRATRAAPADAKKRQPGTT